MKSEALIYAWIASWSHCLAALLANLRSRINSGPKNRQEPHESRAFDVLARLSPCLLLIHISRRHSLINLKPRVPLFEVPSLPILIIKTSPVLRYDGIVVAIFGRKDIDTLDHLQVDTVVYPHCYYAQQPVDKEG
jgi:hypothetical protein